MKIKFILIGKTSFKFIETGMDMYKDRLKHLANFELLIIPDLKNTKKMTAKEVKLKEAALILKALSSTDFVVLLDEKGKSFSSVKFADFIEKKTATGIKKLIFIVGGAYGFSKEMYERGNILLSLSTMTFSHQIIRLFFMEQIYRAFTIIKGLPYHNE